MDNIKTWTRLPVEESVRMTEDRDKWRNYVRGVANPQIEGYGSALVFGVRDGLLRRELVAGLGLLYGWVTVSV